MNNTVDTDDDYIFRPSKGLSFYLYQIYLQEASWEELESDALDVETHWKLIKYIGEDDPGYTVFWDNNIAVTKERDDKGRYKVVADDSIVYDEQERIWKSEKRDQYVNDRIKRYSKSERYWNPDDPNDPFNGAIDMTAKNLIDLA